ncbi:hypothetical protein LF41_1444 [Lysobacter dokdonensis DS-58]|uniref:Uncharacterized protein n=1 Tax=Lysobacter dokdonensis DS-58 TaxID=1300345 RepID=A0A0A2WIL7_9GAMM|nr:hypothetical protein [Lysobacter dokdonensis]KGQ18090.1 hypothetical protein LF41_1444 [Lysobacter dokdonensis DS-58]
MAITRAMDAHLFEAVLKVAREECAHGSWDELSPVLHKAWDALRGDDAPDWAAVEAHVQASCRDAGYVH